MGATHTATCKWCGKKYQKGNNALIFIKLGSDFCSKKCESAYNAAHGDNGSGSDGNTNRLSKEEERQIKLENEKRELELKAIKEKENEVKKARRAAKAIDLKKQNKPFMAFVVVNQDYIGTGVLFALAMGLPLTFGMGGKVVGIIYSVVIGGVLGFGVYKYLKEMFKKQ